MRRLLAWLCGARPTASLPHHSDAELWSEEAFYGMAERLYAEDPHAS